MILFITDFLNAVEQGAKHLTRSHYKTLCDVVGKKNVSIVSLNCSEKPIDENVVYTTNHPNKLQKLINCISNSDLLISRKDINNITSIIADRKYDFVFIDHSIYGHLIKSIKKSSNIQVVSFFHGVMKIQNEEYEKHNKTSIFYNIPKNNINNSELLTIKYSDKCILLNERDNENLYKIYKRNADLYLPVYLGRSNHNIKAEKSNNGDELKLLFVGGYFWPNIHGLIWFADNVMKKLPNNIKLYVVGNNMDKLKNQLDGNNIKIIGRVDDLDSWYNDSDLVVGPIFEGEGMKTKTCEALRYGKIYLGTDEAYEGYTGFDEYKCNNEKEFIDKINYYNVNRPLKYYAELQKIYDEEFSPDMAYRKIKNLVTELANN